MKKQNLKNRILAAAACVVLLISTLVMPIGAEEAAPASWEISQPEDTLTWLEYPGANLIQYPFNLNTVANTNGLTFNIQSNGTIHVTGTSTANTFWYFTNVQNLDTNKTYSLSGCPKNGSSGTYMLNIQLPINNSNEYHPDTGNGNTFKPNSTNGRLYIFIAGGQNVDLLFKPMFAQSNTPQEFMPYLPYVMDQYINQGYTNGFEEGEQSTYENINDLQQNIFDKATFDSATTFSTDPEQHMFINNFTPDKTESGVYFNKLHQRIINEKGESFCQEYMENTFITLTWADEDTWNWSLYGLFIQGDSMVQSATLTTIDGKKYTLDASGNSADLRQFTILETDVSYPVTVKSIRIRIGRSYDLLTSFTILNHSKEYNLGYTNGYVAGVTDKDSDQYTAGFIAGKKDGILIGKQEGLELAKKGDWTNLFTAVVEAPVNTFQSLFNFEILGLDMRAAFGSMLAICVLLIIIKKVIL